MVFRTIYTIFAPMKLKKRYIILLLGAAICQQATAQNAVAGLVRKLGTFIDSLSAMGKDRRYIEVPKRPWQLIVKGNISQTIVSMKAQGTLLEEEYNVKTKFKTVPSQYVGIWAGYRGYGLGYTVNVGGDKGRYFTIGATGGSYGINVRIHSFENSHPDFYMDSGYFTEEDKLEMEQVKMLDPIEVKTVIADGYYLFNGRKFSYAAAYDQSVIQRRSAGSVMAGVMYNYTHIDYSSESNGDLIYLMRGLGKVKLWQASVGVGYAYNWVPARGLLVNVLAMPMLTFVNKIKAYRFNTNVMEMLDEPTLWDLSIPEEERDRWYYEHVRIEPAGDKTFNSGLSIGFDGRVSLTYNLDRYFFNVCGQFNNIRYRHDGSHGYLDDWFVNTSVGIRL